MEASQPFDPRLARMVRASRFAERALTADPALEGWLATQGGHPYALSSMRSAIDAGTLETLDRSLRKLRRRVLVHLIFRDVNGLADLDEVMVGISALAEVSLQAALAFHRKQLLATWAIDPPAGDEERAELFSDDRAELSIVGMGKLGAAELNVSSDIDLIFIHAEDGEAGADRSWHEFHSELGKRVIKSLDAVDADGFVFRVDMRLRPYGASGPLVTSLVSLAEYFRTQGRPWERYAWLKARTLTGAPSTAAALSAITTPFVYRRYHDYAAIDEMRELHGQIRTEATRRNKLSDIKVGEGGIREVEFVVQLHQLMRGGRELSLQTPSTLLALSRLGALGLMPVERVARLERAYAFLRNLEHRLQYLDDQQTQTLPTGAEDRQRIAEAMNYPDWEAFERVLGTHRATVTAEFESLFATAPASVPSIAPTASGAAANQAEASALQTSVQTQLAENALDEGERAEIARRIDLWQSSARAQSLSPRSRQRLETLLPAALRAALSQQRAKLAFFRLFDLLEAVDKRETYLALLLEYPAVLDRLARIVAMSAWAADFVKRHPVVLDELVRAPAASAAVDWRAERERLQAACDAEPDDVERQYELLRNTKQSILFRLNVADIEGRLGVMALSDELSALADMLLGLTVRLAWQALYKDIPFGGFAVIGYGKLGSKELGYASDLDLVFVFDEAGGQTGNNGPERYARLGQRVNSWLNTMTAGGVLYETDLRLRPDGAAGLLVSSLAAYADYQQSRAWTWEHQALTRARWCAGDPALAAPFQAARDAVLSHPRDREKLRVEIVAMRDKMRAEKKDRAPDHPHPLDLKNTVGGIVDIEFIVQYLILAYAHEHPEFLGNLGNFALLTRAGGLGILDEEDAAHIAKAYLAYRKRLHQAQINNERKAWIAADELAPERAAVARVWRAVLGEKLAKV